MATLVLTVIGDDKSGLVDALSGVISIHGGNWDKSRMARLAGKFAGIVMVTIPDGSAEALVADLEPLEARGLLDITVEQAAGDSAVAETRRIQMEVFGLDHPGIIHEISHALAERDVSIEELSTETRDAPMASGTVFEAHASLLVPLGFSTEDLVAGLDHLAAKLAVDIDFTDET